MHIPRISTSGLENWQRTLFILFFAQLMVAVGFSSIFPFMPLYVEELGSTTGLSIEFLSGMVYSAQAFTMMLASPCWGALADRYGRKIMVERSMFGGAVILLLMSFRHIGGAIGRAARHPGADHWHNCSCQCSAGLGNPPQTYRLCDGVLLSVGFGTGIAVGPLIGGAVADLFGYSAVFYITAALLFLAGIIVHWGIQEKFSPVESGHGGGNQLPANCAQPDGDSGYQDDFCNPLSHQPGTHDDHTGHFVIYRHP